MSTLTLPSKYADDLNSDISTNTDETNIKEVSESAETKDKTDEWKILVGLRDGETCEFKPEKYEGYLMKRRKWPLKGWHKRYFALEKGLLTYAKSSYEMARGKIHGSIDIGLSVISTKTSGRRIDIDAEEQLYHLKVKNSDCFQSWIKQLHSHRLYRQHEIAFGTENPFNRKVTTPIDKLSDGASLPPSYTQSLTRFNDLSPWNATHHPCISAYPQSRVAAWILDSAIEDQGNDGVTDLQSKLCHLEMLLQQLESTMASNYEKNMEDVKKFSGKEKFVKLPEVKLLSTKEERTRFGLKKKNRHMKEKNQHNKITAADEQKYSKSRNTEINICRDKDFTFCKNKGAVFSESEVDRNVCSSALTIQDMAHLSCSHPSLTVCDDIGPYNLPGSVSLMTCALSESVISSSPSNICDYQKEFFSLAKEIYSGLYSALKNLKHEKENLLKKSAEIGNFPDNNYSSIIAGGQSYIIQQSRNLSGKLQSIPDTNENSPVIPQATPTTPTGDVGAEADVIHQPVQTSLSHENSSVQSASEFFDAPENFSNCSTSSEGSMSEEDKSALSDISDDGTDSTPIPHLNEVPLSTKCSTGRRSKLPAPKPDTSDFSLWNLLYKNIGKDLCKVCMPVTLNEPLSILQRLCEELEYSELLDKASEIDDCFQRMVYVAAFVVSAYSSSFYRAGHKPFNPVLGETYECIREDKGFKFIAEQVSHHPPVSVCHAESKNFIFHQDMRIKTKFWGKSMEIIPIGKINVHLPRTNDHYQWNKVTTCVHNVFSGQRWADQYGEMLITEKTRNVHCKLTFVKASYWSSKRQEVYGVVMNKEGDIIHNLFGKWTESLYCGIPPSITCIWRPGAMPEDYELYYGFTRFAIELNEISPVLNELLPPTDTRRRPDQRLLEEGNVTAAETNKQQIEQSQRERRKKREEMGLEYKPMWFQKEIQPDGSEEWVYTHKYWEIRLNPGFKNISFPEKLW